MVFVKLRLTLVNLLAMHDPTVVFGASTSMIESRTTNDERIISASTVLAENAAALTDAVRTIEDCSTENELSVPDIAVPIRVMVPDNAVDERRTSIRRFRQESHDPASATATKEFLDVT